MLTRSYNGYQTFMPPGHYCNTLVPGCSSKVQVGSDGTAAVSVASKGSLAICMACNGLAGGSMGVES